MASTAFRRSLRRALHHLPPRPAVIAPSTPHPLPSLRRQFSRPSSLNAYLPTLNQKPFPTPHPLLSLRRQLSRPSSQAYLCSTAQKPAVAQKPEPMAKNPAVDDPTAQKPAVEPMAKNPAVDPKPDPRTLTTFDYYVHLFITFCIFYEWVIDPLVEILKVWLHS